jgi:hypothetical protein
VCNRETVLQNTENDTTTKKDSGIMRRRLFKESSLLLAGRLIHIINAIPTVHAVGVVGISSPIHHHLT